MERARSRCGSVVPLTEKGRERDDSGARRGKKHRAKPFGPRVSEIRHCANFPKAARWLSPRRIHGQSRSMFNFSTANRVPPASWELLPRVSTTTLLLSLSLSRDFPSVISISSFLFFCWKSAKTLCPIVRCFMLAARSSIKTLLSFNIWKCEKIA